jgi:hypothetical protein
VVGFFYCHVVGLVFHASAPVPQPRLHRRRFHRVLAPSAKLRAKAAGLTLRWGGDTLEFVPLGRGKFPFGHLPPVGDTEFINRCQSVIDGLPPKSRAKIE